MKLVETTQNDMNFSCLPLKDALLRNLELLSYHTMTPIQQQSLPSMLAGGDLIAKACTGSGKTAAFGLSLLNHLEVKELVVQGLILCPTRELAEQVSQTLRSLARLIPNVKILNLSGGSPLRPQTHSLKHGAHLIVGTPGRIQKHLDNKALALKHLKILVLDEADRMLDMGFFDAIKSIISLCPIKRQTLLFSATYPDEINKIAEQFMKNPIEVSIDSEHKQKPVEQYFYELQNPSDKFDLLKRLLTFYKPLSTIIFCNTRQQTAELSKALNRAGFSSLALHGDMDQQERDLVTIKFINQSCNILISTDIAARGIDIKKLSAVINFDLAFEPETHIHRIGRTGRAGEEGLALSITTQADAQRICAIEEQLKVPLQWQDIESIPQKIEPFPKPQMATICFNVGRKDKIRPGDILGALIKDSGLFADQIGKIDVNSLETFVAIHQDQIEKVCHHFKNSKLKGQKVQLRQVN